MQRCRQANMRGNSLLFTRGDRLFPDKQQIEEGYHEEHKCEEKDEDHRRRCCSRRLLCFRLLGLLLSFSLSFHLPSLPNTREVAAGLLTLFGFGCFRFLFGCFLHGFNILLAGPVAHQLVDNFRILGHVSHDHGGMSSMIFQGQIQCFGMLQHEVDDLVATATAAAMQRRIAIFISGIQECAPFVSQLRLHPQNTLHELRIPTNNANVKWGLLRLRALTQRCPQFHHFGQNLGNACGTCQVQSVEPILVLDIYDIRAFVCTLFAQDLQKVQCEVHVVRLTCGEVKGCVALLVLGFDQ
mmetsp:Transcript_89617/g.148996  ORF Transcript_89617/g.148996 Transcript_89617/m.148996 type:complete len:297 (-) Transcript_89617:485-1375(-)